MQPVSPNPSEPIEDRVYKIEMRQAAFDAIKPIVEVIAILAAGVWAFYQFIYTDKIAPFLRTPSLSVQTSLAKLGTRDGWIAVQATDTIVNDSKIRVRVLARSENLFGLRVVKQPALGAYTPARGLWNVNTEYHYARPQLLQSHALLFTGNAQANNRRWWLDPGDVVRHTTIFFVPRGKFDVLQLDTNLQYTKYAGSPPFHTFTQAGGAHVLRPASNCVHYDESPACPVTGQGTLAQLSLW